MAKKQSFTRERQVYWAATSIVAAVMVFSAINFNLANPVGPMKGAFVHLGFPDYFRIELTVAKVLGVVALVWRGIPRRAREFAYAGFAITLTSASVAHFSVGDAWLFVIDPLFFLGALIVSYVYLHKIRRHEAAQEAALCERPPAWQQRVCVDQPGRCRALSAR